MVNDPWCLILEDNIEIIVNCSLRGKRCVWYYKVMPIAYLENFISFWSRWCSLIGHRAKIDS